MASAVSLSAYWSFLPSCPSIPNPFNLSLMPSTLRLLDNCLTMFERTRNSRHITGMGAIFGPPPRSRMNKQPVQPVFRDLQHLLQEPPLHLRPQATPTPAHPVTHPLNYSSKVSVAMQRCSLFSLMTSTNTVGISPCSHKLLLNMLKRFLIPRMSPLPWMTSCSLQNNKSSCLPSLRRSLKPTKAFP